MGLRQLNLKRAESWGVPEKKPEKKVYQKKSACVDSAFAIRRVLIVAKMLFHLGIQQRLVGTPHKFFYKTLTTYPGRPAIIPNMFKQLLLKSIK